MRHGKKFNHLGRKSAHRKAMLSNMASSLILHKRISTTVPKAKALRKYVEPLITRSKDDNTHNRRTAFSYLQDKETVHELFTLVADKVAQRPGGYTRIIKTGARLGDNAEMCIMELVDFNEVLVSEGSEQKTSRRSRRSKSGSASETPKAEAAATAEAAPVAEVAEAPAEEAPEAPAEEAPEKKDEE